MITPCIYPMALGKVQTYGKCLGVPEVKTTDPVTPAATFPCGPIHSAIGTYPIFSASDFLRKSRSSQSPKSVQTSRLY